MDLVSQSKGEGDHIPGGKSYLGVEGKFSMNSLISKKIRTENESILSLNRLIWRIFIWFLIIEDEESKMISIATPNILDEGETGAQAPIETQSSKNDNEENLQGTCQQIITNNRTLA